jgi:TRAP-type mannitol/chloroaromatic compound transport system permease small subunit
MNALLNISESLRRMLEVTAQASGWLLVIRAAVTCFDVLARKTVLHG